MTCSTDATVVNVGAVNEGRRALVDGFPQFSNGVSFTPLPELLGYLQMAADFGATCSRYTAVANVLAYLITMGADSAPHFVVQYPKADDPNAYGNDDEPCVEFAVVSFPATAWPCIKCHVIDGGTLRIWPSEVSTCEVDDDEVTIHEVCLVHGTVERLSTDEDEDSYDEYHARWCDGSCEGAC